MHTSFSLLLVRLRQIWKKFLVRIHGKTCFDMSDEIDKCKCYLPTAWSDNSLQLNSSSLGSIACSFAASTTVQIIPHSSRAKLGRTPTRAGTIRPCVFILFGHFTWGLASEQLEPAVRPGSRLHHPAHPSATAQILRTQTCNIAYFSTYSWTVYV